MLQVEKKVITLAESHRDKSYYYPKLEIAMRALLSQNGNCGGMKLVNDFCESEEFGHLPLGCNGDYDFVLTLFKAVLYGGEWTLTHNAGEEKDAHS